METLSKKRVQVYLPQAQVEELRRLAAQRGVTLSALLQQSVAALLDDEAAPGAPVVSTAEEWDASMPVEEHPLWGIVSLGRSGFSDIAANHDQYLAEILAEESQAWPRQSS